MVCPVESTARYRYFSWPFTFSRVGGGAQPEDRAGLRPPLKLHVQFYRMQLSARAPSWRTRLKMKFQQAYQPQLAI
jgi:hypothetical protein